MSDDLQCAVDDLATRLRRPVLLEDARQRVVAYSEQTEPMDDVRRDSILRRHTTADVRAWLRATGVFDSVGPLRIPAAPGLGLLPRVCVPARHDGRLLGFLWLIDAEPVMPDGDVALAAAAVPGLALTLFHDSLVAELSAQREREAVTALLHGDAGAAGVLLAAGVFPAGAPVTALVVRPCGEPDRAALEHALLSVRFRYAARHPVHLVRSDHGVLLLTGRPVDLAEAMPMPVVVGVGQPRPELAAAAESYREARHAADVAARIPGFGPTAEWAKLGVYRLLSQVPPGELHPGVQRLLADPQHLPLLETLENYLDLAGNAVAAAKALRLHRTSLYYRLRRVEELAGTDLKDGGERLVLHLSLKLARLAGRYRPRSAAR